MTRKMKDSGVEWIGEIPEDWDSVSLNRVLKLSITDGPHETPEYVDDGIPFISVDSLGFGEKANLDIVKKYITEEDYEIFNKKTNLETGDILFTKAATIGKLAIKDERKFMVWSPIAVIKPNDQMIESEFLYNVFSSNKYISHVTLLGTSNTQINVGMGTLEKSKIPLPPIEKQKAIADFLDKKTQEIDNIISKTKKAIEEYKKYKQSLITETVTKGLDGNVEMKDSGIEWIGDIPGHWEVNKLKYFYSIVSGTTPTNKGENWNGEILWVTPADYNTEDILIKDSKRKITELGVINSSLSIIPINSIIVSNRAPIGKIALNEKEVTTNQGCKALVLKKPIDNKFTYYSLSIYSDVLNMLGRGTTFLELSGRELSNFVISIPPLEKQIEIVEFLNKKTNQIDQIISTKEKLLREMEVYKKSLIYETVTGKREME